MGTTFRDGASAPEAAPGTTSSTSTSDAPMVGALPVGVDTPPVPDGMAGELYGHLVEPVHGADSAAIAAMAAEKRRAVEAAMRREVGDAVNRASNEAKHLRDEAAGKAARMRADAVTSAVTAGAQGERRAADPRRRGSGAAREGDRGPPRSRGGRQFPPRRWPPP